MKSGKHFSASESLDNLPLTHPEHFSNPVGSGRRRRGDKGGNDGSKNNSEDEDSSSDAESETVSSSYLANIGRVVWAENTDKKAKGRRSAALLRPFTHNL